jgi:hypothetical protein
VSTAAGAKRALRDRPLVRVAIVVILLALAFLASRSCAGGGDRISQDEAIAIARDEVAYEPDRVHVRFFRRGIPSTGFWAVSLSTVEEGVTERQTVVIIHAATGTVTEVQEQSG